MRLAAPLRDAAFHAAALQPGERVLDLGCGPRTNFERVRDAVGTDGHLAGLDSRSFQTAPLSALDPLFERALALTVDHRRDQTPLAAIRDTFRTTDVVETFDAGAGYLAVARKRAD